jgi:transposase, IS30 family
MKYKHLSINEREIIQSRLWEKVSVRDIAKELERSPASISREINRNIPLKRIYKPRLAHERALEKRKSRGRKLRLKSVFIRRYVISHLKEGYSPEQIAGRLHREHPSESISHEAVYQYIYDQVYREGRGTLKRHRHDLRKYLKRRHKHRAKHGMRKTRRVLRPKGPCIDERPKEVEKRKVIGHWETDSMVSRKSSVGLNTIVERKTGLVFITKIENTTAEVTKNTVTRRLDAVPNQFRKTVTSDNGSENALYDCVMTELGILWYFAHPYHSWERGTNENTNGLIRWYFPKGTDFATISDETIKIVEDALNNRPRKRLGWKTPLEAFNESVALTD